MQLSWKPQGNNSLKLVYVDQFGTKNEVNLQSGVTDYTLSDLKAGFRYEFSLVVTDEATGDVFSGSASGNIPSPGHELNKNIANDFSHEKFLLKVMI